MSIRPSGSRLEELRAQFLTASDPDLAVPPDLLESWLRSKSALGAPANVRDVPRVDEDLLDNHLLEMFQAPMARAAEDLAGSGGWACCWPTPRAGSCSGGPWTLRR